jgi:hypothetical protein
MVNHEPNPVSELAVFIIDRLFCHHRSLSFPRRPPGLPEPVKCSAGP